MSWVKLERLPWYVAFESGSFGMTLIELSWDQVVGGYGGYQDLEFTPKAGGELEGAADLGSSRGHVQRGVPAAAHPPGASGSGSLSEGEVGSGCGEGGELPGPNEQQSTRTRPVAVPIRQSPRGVSVEVRPNSSPSGRGTAAMGNGHDRGYAASVEDGDEGSDVENASCLDGGERRRSRHRSNPSVKPEPRVLRSREAPSGRNPGEEPRRGSAAGPAESPMAGMDRRSRRLREIAEVCYDRGASQ